MIAGSDRRVPFVVVAMSLIAGAALADPPAVELFKEGRALAKAGKYAAACEKFERSQEIDPQLGTLFNIAQCEEKTGKLAAALAAYREVVAKDTVAERRTLAAQYAAKLGPRVPKIVVQIASPPASLVVTLDGATGARPIGANQPVEVDLGDYNIVARADGYREQSSKVHVASEGGTTAVPITLTLVHEQETPVAPAEPAKPTEDHAQSHSHRKTYGYVALGAGGAAIATGFVFGAIANGKWSDAKAVCGGTVCPTQAQVDRAQALASDARSAGDRSTALFVVGGALATAGLVLWLTAPDDEHAVHVTASATSTSTGLAIGGRF
jgi:hypothetical protein